LGNSSLGFIEAFIGSNERSNTIDAPSAKNRPQFSNVNNKQYIITEDPKEYYNYTMMSKLKTCAVDLYVIMGKRVQRACLCKKM